MSKKKQRHGVLQIVMTGLLVIAAFAIGSMWTELKMLKGEGGTVKQIEQGEQAQVPGEEEITELTKDQWNELLADTAAIRGSDDAQVTIVEFTDYQCPFCKRHFDETEGQILTEYVETGKVKHIMRDLPLSFHANAHLAAEAARCAGDQEIYWQYHNKLFETQPAWSEGEASTLFKSYAGQLGLNQADFDSCLDEGKHVQAVDDDLALAEKIGTGGTPSFFVNGKSIVGAQPFAAFKIMIDEALENN